MKTYVIDAILRESKKLKFFIRGIYKGQYPRKELPPRVLKFEQRAFESHKGTLNCFISWKSTKLTKLHAEQYLRFIEINTDVQFWFFDDDSQDLWMQENFQSHPIYPVYKGIRFAATKNDVFRLCLLFKYGGAYTSINRCFHIKLKDLYSEPERFLISFEKNIYEREYAEDIPIEFRKFNVVQHTLFSPPRHKILEIAINRIVKYAPQYDKVIFKSVKEAVWRFTSPYCLTDAVDEYLTEYGAREVQFCGIQYNNTCFIPAGAEFRYAKSPSYLGGRNRMILDMDRSDYSN